MLHKNKTGPALCLVVLIAGSACRAGPTPSSASRESAYRANNVGVALLEQANYEQAAASFRRALQIDPGLTIAHVNLSLALQYAQDLVGAAREAAEAGRLLPTSAQPPYISGLVARADNRREDAIRFFERVRQLNAQDVGARVNLAQLYLEDRKYADAIGLLRPAVADEPYNVTATYTLGLALTRSGNAGEGRPLLERSQALRSTGYAVAFGTGYLEQGRLAEGIASTGAEAELVDPTPPTISFSRSAVAAARSTVPPTIDAPFGRSLAPEGLAGAGAAALAASLGGALTLIDFDGDGDLDMFEATADGQRLLRNDGKTWTDVTSQSGLDRPPAGGVPIGCVAADYDNDGRPDLFVLRYGSSVLYRNEGNGVFRDVSPQAHLPPYPFLPGAAAFVDVDHDGDVDLVIAGLADVERTRAAGKTAVFPREFAPAPLQLLRNNGNGTFTDITREAGLQATGHAIAIVPTDFDNHRDIDLLVAYRDAPPKLFKNQRDGTFRDVAAEVGLGAIAGAGDEITAMTAADVNKDDYPDFFFARASGAALALSDGQGRFTMVAGPSAAKSAAAAQFADYDADGLLDLLTWSGDRLHVFRNLGHQWSDVSDKVGAAGQGDRTAVRSARALAVADVDRDGFPDVITGGPSISLWHNGGDSRHRSQRVDLKGVVSNRLAIGSKIQIRAGSLSARIETSAATPPVAAVDGVFGLGARTGADVVRVLWPSGILQTETAPGSATPGGAAPDDSPMLPLAIVVTELDRKPSSCPFLFTWDGERFQFVTDFMGAGEMGYWEGPRRWNRPFPVEYVRIAGSQLQPKDSRFEIRVTNELEEALFADRLQLIAIAHPREIEVFPNEGMSDPPKRFQLHAARDERMPSKVTDDHGHDVTERIARVDRRYPDDFGFERFRGYAREHSLTIDIGSTSASITLLLTGWTDYAFSSDNRAAHQAGLSLSSPVLQARDAGGRWRTVVADIGIPVGRPQTIALDLAGKLRAGEHELRIVTNMRIYWDQIHVATTVTAGLLRSVRLDPVAASLRVRGFSAEARPDGKEPAGYDYARVTSASPWKAMLGRYTREGDVRELLVRSDDQFVVAKSGDEIAVQFDATAAGPLPDGWTRTFLLMADGYSKEMDVNSASPDVLEPLPFHAMSRYPYAAPEHYPDTPAHQRYLEMYNQRVVSRSLPPLDLPLSVR